MEVPREGARRIGPHIVHGDHGPAGFFETPRHIRAHAPDADKTDAFFHNVFLYCIRKRKINTLYSRGLMDVSWNSPRLGGRDFLKMSSAMPTRPSVECRVERRGQ